jgi:PAS domain S-box-containing protein
MKPAARRPLPSIRTQIYTLVWACALPAVVGFALLANNFFERERAQIQHETLITARALMRVVDRDLNTGISVAMALSHSPSLDRGDLAAFQRQATRALGPEFPGFNFVLSDRDSVQLLNTVRPFGGPMADPGSLDRIRKVFDTGRTVVSDVFIGGALKRPLVAVHVPVIRDGKVIYCISVGFVPERLGKVLMEQGLSKERVAGIFDTQGVIVARTIESEKYAGKPGSPSLLAQMGRSGDAVIESTTHEGTPVYSMISHSKATGWAVVIGVPRSTVLAEMLESIRWISLLVAGLLAMGFAMAWYFARRIGDSVSILSLAATALGRGDAAASERERARARPIFREADDALQTLHAVEAELRLYRDRLESVIEERTLQLQSARREAIDKELRTRTVMENVGDGIITINARGVIESFNRAASGIFGYTTEEAVGSNIMRLMPERMRGPHGAGMKRYLAGGAPTVVGKNNVELEGLRKNGTTFALQLSIRALHVGGQPLFVGIVRDVTEQKRAETELRQAMEQVQIASAAKDIFVANMSHELRTPMNAVLGMAHLLSTTGLSQEQARYLEMIRASGQSLLGILNDILDYSKMTAGKIEIHPVRFHLDEVLHSLASIMSVSVGDKNLELCMGVELDVPRMLAGDDAAPAAGADQPGRQRDQVHRARRGGGVAARAAAPAGGGAPADLGARHRHRHRRRRPAAHLRGLRAGRGVDHAALRRHWPGPVDLPAPGADDGRRAGAGQPARRGQQLPFRTEPAGAGRRRRAGRVGAAAAGLARADRGRQRDWRARCWARWPSLQWSWTWRPAAPRGAGAAGGARTQHARAYQVVFIDWQMPGMDGPAAMSAIQRQMPGVPVICMVNAFGRNKLVQEAASKEGVDVRAARCNRRPPPAAAATCRRSCRGAKCRSRPGRPPPACTAMRRWRQRR